MNANYCHNCRHWESLVDGTHCNYCLTFWQSSLRMPTPADDKPPMDPVQRINAELDALIASGA